MSASNSKSVQTRQVTINWKLVYLPSDFLNLPPSQYDDLSVRLASPSQLQAKPEADEMGFGKYFTDHMMKVYHHRSLGGWQKPEITPLENLVLHPAAKVLHYAVEVSQQAGLK